MPSSTISSTRMRGLSELYGILEDDLEIFAQRPQCARA